MLDLARQDVHTRVSSPEVYIYLSFDRKVEWLKLLKLWHVTEACVL
jgi:hypothetical protein